MDASVVECLVAGKYLVPFVCRHKVATEHCRPCFTFGKPSHAPWRLPFLPECRHGDSIIHFSAGNCKAKLVYSLHIQCHVTVSVVGRDDLVYDFLSIGSYDHYSSSVRCLGRGWYAVDE